MSEFEKALQFVKIAQSLDPSSLTSQIQTIRILMKQGKSDEAATALGTSKLKEDHLLVIAEEAIEVFLTTSFSLSLLLIRAECVSK